MSVYRCKKFWNFGFAAVLCLVLFCSNSERGVLVYVSPDGSDDNPGTKGEPFATLTKARDALRAVETDEQKKIIVRGGKYYEVNLILGPEDSGLTIMPMKGEQPVLYGGRPVANWEKDGDNFYSAELPGVREGEWDFRSLVVNDEYRPRARYPEDGTLEHRNEFQVRWMSTTGGGWERKPTHEELTTMNIKEGDLGEWLEVRNAELTVYHQWDESVVGVESFDMAAHTIVFSNPAGHPPGAFYHSPKAKTYIVWNIKEGMTHPGQWYLDRAAGKLVYWPKQGEDMAGTRVIAPTTEKIIDIKEDAQNLTIRGLTLSATTTPLVAGGFGASRFDGAITGADIRDCEFANLSVKNVGGWGFKLRGGNVHVEGCEVTGTGAGGIQFRGTNFLITQNHVHDVGVTYPSAIAVSGGGKDGPSEISHNEIHNTTYSAITCGGDGHFIGYNVIYDTMRELFDGGGIYITFCKGITLRGNVIRGSNVGYKRHAYYLDEQAEKCIVENNLAFNTVSPFHTHMATKDNVFRNNVIIDEGESHFEFHKCANYLFEKNVIYAQEGIYFYQPDAITQMPNNVLYSKEGKIVSEWPQQGSRERKEEPLVMKDGSVSADPQFTDPENGDYSFKSGSPAIELGIEPIDVSGAGRH